MFDAELQRKLCQELTHERDPERLHELLSLFCALVHDDDEQEVRCRGQIWLGSTGSGSRTGTSGLSGLSGGGSLTGGGNGSGARSAIASFIEDLGEHSLNNSA